MKIEEPAPISGLGPSLSSFLIPRSSFLRLHSSFFNPQSSFLSPLNSLEVEVDDRKFYFDASTQPS